MVQADHGPESRSMGASLGSGEAQSSSARLRSIDSDDDQLHLGSPLLAEVISGSSRSTC